MVFKLCITYYSYTRSNSVFKTDGNHFNWSPTTQGVILSSYFYGCTVIQPFTGWLCTRFDAAYLVTGGMAVSTLLTLLTPLATKYHVAMLFIVRLVMGLCHGPFNTSEYIIYSKWTTKAERATALGSK